MLCVFVILFFSLRFNCYGKILYNNQIQGLRDCKHVALLSLKVGQSGSKLHKKSNVSLKSEKKIKIFH